MTIVAGFSGFGGVVLCSDSQETVNQYAKRTVQKIRVENGNNNWQFALAGAGSGPYVDMVTQSLVWALKDVPEHSVSDVKLTIERTIAEHYKTHVWPRGESKDSAEVEFLIVAAPINVPGQAYLFHTNETAVNWCQDQKAIGVGSYLADYLMDHILVHRGDQYHLLAVAAYVLKKTRDYIEGCGKESTIYLYPGDGTNVWLWPEELEKLEKVLDDFDKSTKEIFQVITDVGTKYNPPHMMDLAIKEFREVEEQMRQLIAARDAKEAKMRLWKNASKRKLSG